MSRGVLYKWNVVDEITSYSEKLTSRTYFYTRKYFNVTDFYFSVQKYSY